MVSPDRKARWEKRDNVAWLYIDAPESRNALSVEVIRDVQVSLNEIKDVDEVGAVCITGAGDVAFCAGMNLKDLGRLNPDRPPLDVGPMHDAIRHFPKPTIAVVNGYCVGGGISLLANCDLAIASEEKGLFGLPEIIRGGPPGRAIGEIAHMIAVKNVFDLILSGRNWDAHKAQAVGIINRVAPHAELEQAAQTWASDIGSFNQPALMYAKRTIHKILNILPHDDRIETNSLMSSEMRADGHHGMFGGEGRSALAFIEKRSDSKATWREV